MERTEPRRHDALHRSTDGIATDGGSHAPITDIVVVSHGKVVNRKQEGGAGWSCPSPCEQEADALGGIGVVSAKVLEHLLGERARETDDH